jgi:glycosyltransferase involved in cell wall biosynthesis
MGPRYGRRSFTQLWWRLLGKNERTDRRPEKLLGAAEAVAEIALREQVDAVVCPSTMSIALLPASMRTVLILDAFFDYNRGRYKAFDNLTPRYLAEGVECDELALMKTAGVVVPTKELADALTSRRLVPEDRVRVVPWGPNIVNRQGVLSEAELEDRFKRREILFVGREWHRKGLDIVLSCLARSGDFTCTVIGLEKSKVPGKIRAGTEGRVQFLGDLNPSDERHSELIAAAFRRASVLFVPTRAENFGITFVEALGFGLPIITYDTDGLRHSIGASKAINLVAKTASVAEFHSALLGVFSDWVGYRTAAAAAIEQSKSFSWDRVADAVLELIQKDKLEDGAGIYKSQEQAIRPSNEPIAQH